MKSWTQSRREFIGTLATAGAVVTQVGGLSAKADTRRKIKLGIDNFAVRAMNWKADALLDYAAKLKTDSLLISDLNAFTTREEGYLTGLRKKAADLGLQIHLGTWSICPTSKSFRKDWGSAEEHLALGIRMAKSLGSPVLRVVLGSGDDRKTPGGIEARIEDTVKVCKKLKSQSVDAGVKIAVENHAGDLQSWELVQLIEAAGKDFVGANMDSGNATWTMEDPMTSLEILGPYALTTSLRDSAVWESAKGATVQWTAMGEGNVDLSAYFKRFTELCPNVPVHIETISGFNREIPYLEPGFWGAFPNASVSDFARFIALAKKGKVRAAHQHPPGSDGKLAEQEYQKAEVELSVKNCKERFGLGEKV